MTPETGIRDALSRALATFNIEHEPDDITLEFPAEMKNGDIASSVSLKYAKQAGMAPRTLAEKIVGVLGPIEGVEKIETAGPGFINFYFAPRVFADVLQAIIDRPHDWGRNDLCKAERVMVEFTDPNPFKEFHIGHLMSNAIGESISRLFEYAGATVMRANYQGDVGPHVAKAIWALQKFGLDPTSVADLGKAYAGGAAAYENDQEAQREIDAINKEVYERTNPVVNEIYGEGRKASLRHFEDIYRTLGTTFDHYFFESESAPRGMRLVEAHRDIFDESEGAIVYKGEKEGLHTRVFITSRGTPTYETKDLGLLEMKQEAAALDRSITVTAHEQADYFAVMLAAARHIPELRDIANKTTHTTHGMMRFAEGKMSSRTGNVVTGESLLAELSEAARQRAAKSRAADANLLATQIAVAAIKYQILRQSSGKDIIFDRTRALSLEGDSGPYVQYAYARAEQVLAKAKEEGIPPAYDEEAVPGELVRLLVRFPHEVQRAVELVEPHLVTTYLTELAAAFNRWYAEEKILDGTPSAARKLAITDAVRITIKHCLFLLGIPAPEKM